MKNLFATPEIVEKKVQKIEAIFTKTINRLTKLNEEIDVMVKNEDESISEYQKQIQEAEARKNRLFISKEKNTKLKKKFEDFLNVNDEIIQNE